MLRNGAKKPSFEEKNSVSHRILGLYRIWHRLNLTDNDDFWSKLTVALQNILKISNAPSNAHTTTTTATTTAITNPNKTLKTVRILYSPSNVPIHRGRNGVGIGVGYFF